MPSVNVVILRRQRGRVVRAPGLKSGGRRFKCCSDHDLVLFLVVPSSTTWLHASCIFHASLLLIMNFVITSKLLFHEAIAITEMIKLSALALCIIDPCVCPLIGYENKPTRSHKNCCIYCKIAHWSASS